MWKTIDERSIATFFLCVLYTISWCLLLLEFLENSWNSEIFFQGPGKLLENIISLYSWNFMAQFHQFYKQNKSCRSI